MTYEKSFIKRLSSLGRDGLILSFDTFLGVLAIVILYFVFDGSFPADNAQSLLQVFATVSATLFALVLTGLTIITSFTDKLFLYAWQEVEEFENIVTTFQLNLFLPIVVLLYSLVLYIQYNGAAMILLISIFVYMMFSLLDLVNLIVSYSLQRGEFVKQQVERAIEEQSSDVPELSDTELVEIYHSIKESNKTSEASKEN